MVNTIRLSGGSKHRVKSKTNIAKRKSKKTSKNNKRSSRIMKGRAKGKTTGNKSIRRSSKTKSKTTRHLSRKHVRRNLKGGAFGPFCSTLKDKAKVDCEKMDKELGTAYMNIKKWRDMLNFLEKYKVELGKRICPENNSQGIKGIDVIQETIDSLKILMTKNSKTFDLTSAENKIKFVTKRSGFYITSAFGIRDFLMGHITTSNPLYEEIKMTPPQMYEGQSCPTT